MNFGGIGWLAAAVAMTLAAEPTTRTLRLVGLRGPGEDPPAIDAPLPPELQEAEGEANNEARKQAAAAFEAGEAAYAQGRYDEAIEHFSRAQRVLPHPFTAYNLGLAMSRNGDVLEAWRIFQSLATSDTGLDDRADADARLAELRPRVSMLRVRRRAGDRVCLDGVELPPERTRVVRPGIHRLQAAGFDRQIELEPGETREVDLRYAVTPTPPPPAEPPPRALTPLLVISAVAGAAATGTAAAATLEDRDPIARGLAIGSASAGAVAVLTGVAALALHMRSKRRRAQEQRPAEQPPAPPTCRPSGEDELFRTGR